MITSLWAKLCLQVLILLTGSSVLGEDACRRGTYVTSCVLDILEEHIEATAIINHCHLPVDITFLISYQYKNLTQHRWKYTFVTTNQNERILIPGLLLPNAPHAPVFLDVRVPESLFNLHNTSFVAIKASFVAQLSEEMWEEADFINQTVYIHTTEDCNLANLGPDPIPWIIGGLFGVTLLLGALGGGLYLYRKKKLEADQLALVSAMEIGAPGSQPYQMDPATTQNPQRVEATDSTSSQPPGNKTNNETSRTGHAKDEANQPNGGQAETVRSGNKGFKFGRLREEESSDSPPLRDTSVVIGNPAFQEDMKVGKDMSNSSSSLPQQPMRHRISPFVITERLVIGNKQTSGGGGSVESQVHHTAGDSEQPVGEEEQDDVDPDINDPTIDEDDGLTQGARRKVRGSVSGSLSDSSALVTSAEASHAADSHKSL